MVVPEDAIAVAKQPVLGIVRAVLAHLVMVVNRVKVLVQDVLVDAMDPVAVVAPEIRMLCSEFKQGVFCVLWGTPLKKNYSKI